MRKTTTTTHIYCDFCGEECIHKGYNDEWGNIWLNVEGRDYAGNGGGSVGATEHQDEKPYEYENEVEVNEVVEKIITRKEWVEV